MSSAVLMRDFKAPSQLIEVRVREPVVGNPDISFAGIDSADHGRSDFLSAAGRLETRDCLIVSLYVSGFRVLVETALLRSPDRHEARCR